MFDSLDPTLYEVEIKEEMRYRTIIDIISGSKWMTINLQNKSKIVLLALEQIGAFNAFNVNNF